MSKTAGLDQITGINTIMSSVAFHIETSNLICSANQITGFYIKCNTGLKWVNVSELTVSKVLQNICLDKFLQSSMKKNARGGIFITCQNQCFHYIKTVQLICRANQLHGFYIMKTFVLNGLRDRLQILFLILSKFKRIS